MIPHTRLCSVPGVSVLDHFLFIVPPALISSLRLNYYLNTDDIQPTDILAVGGPFTAIYSLGMHRNCYF